VRLENLADFCEVELDDLEVTIRDGRLGTRGTSRTVVAKTPLGAIESYEAALVDAMLEGFQRPPGTAPDVTVAERDSPIEQAVRANRNDRDARAIYADWLQGQGNRAGEWIALALQRGSAKHPKLEKRLARLENELRLPLPSRAVFRWKLGMWETVRIENRFDYRNGRPGPSREPFDEPGMPRRGSAAEGQRGVVDVRELVRTVFEHPLCAALEQLTIGALLWNQNRLLTPELLYQARECAWARDLPSLVVGDCRADPDHPHYMTTYDCGAIAKPIAAAFPNLRKLRVWNNLSRGVQNHLQGLVHAGLRDLAICGRVDMHRIRELDEIDVPALERLELWIGGEYRATGSEYVRVEHMASIVSGVKYPNLRHLALVNSFATDRLVVDLAMTPIADKLLTLDLSMGALSNAGGLELAALRPMFSQIKRLNVDDNRLGPEALRMLHLAYPEVVARTQRPTNVVGTASVLIRRDSRLVR
jgi:uncharacterized protein (TIGR02996 family)